MTTAHIFIGSTPYGQDAEFQMALEYSIKKHVSIPVMIYWMIADENPDSPWSRDGKKLVTHLEGSKKIQ